MTDRSTTRTKRASRAVAVIGAGYVGLPTAAVLAHFGHRVVCAEHDEQRLELIESGQLPILERGLEELVAEGRAKGLLSFTKRAEDAVAGAEFVFLCVPTPEGPDGAVDMSAMATATAQMAPHLVSGAIIVNKSTVPMGTAAMVERLTARTDVQVVANPEFLREGSAVADSLHPDRLVIGAEDRHAAARVAELFAETGAPLIITDTTTAETIKYASNAFLATKLSFVNAMAGLCEAVGADVRDLTLGLGYDRRIGFEFLRPGPGWGGPCLPKDTIALVHIAQDAGYDFAILQAVIDANHDQLNRVVTKAQDSVGGSLAGKRIAVLGLTFKANTDDRRNSPATDAAHRMIELGASVSAFDPTVTRAADGNGPADLDGIEICGDPYEACRDATCLVVLTEWDDFRRLDFQKVLDLMAAPNVVDARNLLDPTALRRLGFRYTGIGRL
jgi:UDPglucose 6-dehydrogenase